MAAAPLALRVQPDTQRFSQRKLAQSRNQTLLARTAVAPTLARAGDDLRRDRVP